MKLPVVICWVFVGFFVVPRGHSQVPEKPHGPLTFKDDKNPFRKTSSVCSRLDLIDDASPSLSWFTKGKVYRNGDEFTNTLVKDSFARSYQLDDEQIALLNKLFLERKAKHELNLGELGSIAQSEFRRLLANANPSVKIRLLPTNDLSIKEISEALIEYEKNEHKAEMELLEQIDEVLLPNQFSGLVRVWISIDKLYVPAVAKYLKLSQEQINRIKSDCMERKKFGFEMEEKYPDIKTRTEQILASITWHELNNRPLSHLTPAQFRIAAPLLVKSWRTGPSFKLKLEQLSGDSSLQGKAELKLLGDLYRQGAKLEAEAISEKGRE